MVGAAAAAAPRAGPRARRLAGDRRRRAARGGRLPRGATPLTTPPTLEPNPRPRPPAGPGHRGLRYETGARPTPAWLQAREASAAGPHLGDAWIQYRGALGLRPEYLLGLDEQGRPVAVGVAYESRSRWRLWARSRWSLDRSPWRLPGTTVDDADLIQALAAWARERNASHLDLDSFDGPALEAELPERFQQSRRFEFEWDVTGDEDALWSGLKASHRRKVRKAEKAGVQTADETSPERIEVLRELQGSTRSRRRERGETMALPDEAQYRRLARHLVGGGGARILVARHEGRPVSCLLIGVLGARAYYLMGGSSPQGLELNSASLLMWRAAALLRPLGVERLNLGGVPERAAEEDAAEHGLYRFKDGFGARRFVCRSGVLDLS